MIKSSHITGLSLCALGLLALNACSRHTEPIDGVAASLKKPRPGKTAEETLAQLTPEQQAAFTRWKNSIHKSCNPTEPFGLKELSGTEGKGFDLSLILKNNHGSLMISDSTTGEFAILRSTAPRTSFNLQLNREGLKVAVKRTEMTCTVTLFGTVVYEGYIVPELSVSAYYNPAREFDPLTGPKLPIEFDLDSGTGEMQTNSWSEAIAQVFREDARLSSLLTRKLNLKETDVRLIQFQGDGFRMSGIPNGLRYAFRMLSIPDAVWSGSSSPSLIAPARVLTRLFDGTSRSFDLEVRMAPPKVEDSREVANSGEGAPLRFKIRVAMDPSDQQVIQRPDMEPGQQPGQQLKMMDYTIESVEPLERVNSTEEEALACVLGRATALKALRKPRENSTRISIQELFEPCMALAPQTLPLEGSVQMQSAAIPFALEGVHPGRSTFYSGWDQLVTQLVLKAVRENQDIQLLLDPERKTQVIREISAAVTRLRSALQDQSLSELAEDLYRMGTQWALWGEVVSDARLGEIFGALRKTIIPFPKASKTLIQELAHNPNAQGELLAFANGVNEEYLTALSQAARAAREAGQLYWEKQMYPLVLQKRLSIERLNDMVQNWAMLKAELGKNPALSPLKPELIELISGTNSNPLSRTEAEKVFQALANSAELFPDSSRNLLQTIRNSFDSGKDALEFALKMPREYRDATAEAIKIAAELDLTSYSQSQLYDFLQRRPKLPDHIAQLEVLKSARQFAVREKERLAGSGAADLDRAKGARVRLIHRALSERWSSNDFPIVEQLATVGRAKLGCGHPDVASTVECNSFFLGKSPGLFLDDSFQGRYGPLAIEFAGMLETLNPPGRFLSLRTRLLRAFLGQYNHPEEAPAVIWSRCSMAQLQAKTTELRQTIQSLKQTEDSAEAHKLQQSIRAILKNCPTAAQPIQEGL